MSDGMAVYRAKLAALYARDEPALIALDAEEGVVDVVAPGLHRQREVAALDEGLAARIESARCS
jgi:hypothetical protein